MGKCVRGHTLAAVSSQRTFAEQRSDLRHMDSMRSSSLSHLCASCKLRVSSDSFRCPISIVIAAERCATHKRMDNPMSIVCFECEQRRRNERNRNKIMMMSMRCFESLLSPHTCDMWALSSPIPTSFSIELCASNLCGYSNRHLSTTITEQSRVETEWIKTPSGVTLWVSGGSFCFVIFIHSQATLSSPQ